MSAESNAGGKDKGTELPNLLDLRMPGDSSAVSYVTDSIFATLTQLHVPEEKRLEIALAVQEALANAVVHGCKNDPSSEVRCRLRRDPEGRILIIVTDSGPGFRPQVLPDPKLPDNVYADHGRGVYLIQQLMDEVYFANGGSEIRMWKY